MSFESDSESEELSYDDDFSSEDVIEYYIADESHRDQIMAFVDETPEKLGSGNYSDVYLYEEVVAKREKLEEDGLPNNSIINELSFYYSLQSCKYIPKFYGTSVNRTKKTFQSYIEHLDTTLFTYILNREYSHRVKRFLTFVKHCGTVIYLSHHNNIVINDIKPDNIMYRSARGEFCMIDFGISGFEGYISGQYGENALVDDLYRPPEEHIRDRKASDIWAFGMTCVHFLFQESLLEEDRYVDGIYNYRELMDEDMELPENIAEMLDGMLQVDPTKRWTIDDIFANIEKPKVSIIVFPEEYAITKHHKLILQTFVHVTSDSVASLIALEIYLRYTEYYKEKATIHTAEACMLLGAKAAKLSTEHIKIENEEQVLNEVYVIFFKLNFLIHNKHLNKVLANPTGKIKINSKLEEWTL